MRKVLSIVLAFAIPACAPPMRWARPGTDERTVINDLTTCRRAAQMETMRDFPFYYPWVYPFPYSRTIYWQRAELDRYYAEDRLTSFCMRTKGYELVEVRPEATPAAPPRSPEK